MFSQRILRAVQLKRDTIPSFAEYPFCIPAVRELTSLDTDAPVTVLVGDNGSGKSTVLEAIAVAFGFNAEGGSKAIRFGTRSSHSTLHQHLRLVRGLSSVRDGYFLRAESLFNVATFLESDPWFLGGYGGKSLHEQSHGESFLTLLTTRFRGPGLYLLDEPEAALSPSRQLSALTRIHDLVRAGSQFVIATHSPILMAYPDAKIYLASESGIEERDYESLEHVAITRDFLANPKRMLDELLRDDEQAAS